MKKKKVVSHYLIIMFCIDESALSDYITNKVDDIKVDDIDGMKSDDVTNKVL